MRDPRVCILAHAHPDFSKGGGELAAFRNSPRSATPADPVLVAALETVDWAARARPCPGLMPHAPGSTSSARRHGTRPLGWENGRQRAELVTFLAGSRRGLPPAHITGASGGPDLGPDGARRTRCSCSRCTNARHLHESRPDGPHGVEGAVPRDSPLRCLSCSGPRLDHIALRKPRCSQRCGASTALIYQRLRVTGTRPGPRASRPSCWKLPRRQARRPAAGGGITPRAGAPLRLLRQPDADQGPRVLLQALPLACGGATDHADVHAARRRGAAPVPHLAGAIEAAGRA
jgi:hypothetical protein